MEKISPSKMRKAAFYAISYGDADAFINSLIHIKIALQHASTLAIALAKLIVVPTLGDFYEAAAAAWGQPSPNAAALQTGIKKGANACCWRTDSSLFRECHRTEKPCSAAPAVRRPAPRGQHRDPRRKQMPVQKAGFAGRPAPSPYNGWHGVCLRSARFAAPPRSNCLRHPTQRDRPPPSSLLSIP